MGKNQRETREAETPRNWESLAAEGDRKSPRRSRVGLAHWPQPVPALTRTSDQVPKACLSRCQSCLGEWRGRSLLRSHLQRSHLRSPESSGFCLFICWSQTHSTWINREPFGGSSEQRESRPLQGPRESLEENKGTGWALKEVQLRLFRWQGRSFLL